MSDSGNKGSKGSNSIRKLDKKGGEDEGTYLGVVFFVIGMGGGAGGTKFTRGNTSRKKVKREHPPETRRKLLVKRGRRLEKQERGGKWDMAKKKGGLVRGTSRLSNFLS